MITFNTILSESGLDPTEVLLVRHSVGKHVKNYDAWRTNEPFITNYSPEGETFEQYQQIQRSGRFSTPAHKPIKYWASFIAARTGGTMFIGVYKRIGDRYRAPKPGHEDIIIVSLALDQGLADLRGKLFIEWGQERAWVQFARSNNKPIVELKRVVEDPPFPHWSKFVTKLSALESLPGDWQKALKILTGIYLLSDSETGEARYVGQADGTGGFLARWTEYARNGHGGNLAMQALKPRRQRPAFRLGPSGRRRGH